MKMMPTLSAVVALVMTGCNDFQDQPGSSRTFDPLGVPGGVRSAGPAPVADGFRPGQFVTAMMPKTGFYLKKPEGSADADKLLAVGTSMKVVANEEAFLKVELDTGEVGFVPSIMVEDPNATPAFDSENPYNNLPLDGDFEALPDLPPGGNPPSGALPTVIDPNAPGSNPANPGLDRIPVLPPVEPPASAEPGKDPAPDAKEPKTAPASDAKVE